MKTQPFQVIFAVFVLVFALSLSAPLFVYPQEATHPTLQSAKLPELLSVREFYTQRSTRWSYQVSPDGKKLLWLIRRRLMVESLSDGSQQRMPRTRRARGFRWALDNRRLTFLKDDDGDENYHLYVMDTNEPYEEPEDLTPFGDVKVWGRQQLLNDPSHMIFRMNNRDHSIFDLYRVNLETGDLRVIARNPGDVLNWVVDGAGKVIARYRRLPDSSWILEAKADSGNWTKRLSGTFEETLRVFFYYVPAGADHILALSSLGRDKNAFVRIDLRTGTEKVLFDHPSVDISWVRIDRKTYKPIYALYWDGFPKYHFFDRTLAPTFAQYNANGPADVAVTSSSLDNNVMTLRVLTDRRPYVFYLVNRRTKENRYLYRHPLDRHKDILSKTKPITVKARDGLILHGYLTLPYGTDGKQLPMVLRVHGGPWSRDIWGLNRFNRDIQFFANRGYAVLQVNYRGSSGYGRAHLRGIRREFAGKAHTDLIDAVNWAIKEGIADPKKIAIFGRSYGGYAAQVGMTFTPKVFAAGVSIVGISDLVMTMERFPVYWKLWIARWRDYVGDPKNPKDREDMAKRSPINYVDRMKAPILIVHGANDARVNQDNYYRMIEKMEELELPYEKLMFERSGHSIRGARRQRRLFRKVEQFFAKHLGGRASPPR